MALPGIEGSVLANLGYGSPPPGGGGAGDIIRALGMLDALAQIQSPPQAVATVPMPPQPVVTAPMPPPTVPPGAVSAASGPASSPPVTVPMPALSPAPVSPGPWRAPPSEPVQSPGSPLLEALFGLFAGEPTGPDAPLPGSAAVLPPPGPSAPVTVPMPAPIEAFAGGSMLQNPNIALPSLPGTGRPPASAGVGPGGAAPRPSSTPVAGPPSSPPDAGPSASQSGTGASSGDSGRGSSRLMDTLAIIGMVLSQPPPPGGNIVSQIGKAMGTGFIYNKMMDSAEQEQVAAGKKQSLAERQVANTERTSADRSNIEDRRTRLDEMMTPAQIENLRTRTLGTQQEIRMREIEQRYKNDPVRRDLELRKLQTEIAGTEARTDLTRNQIESSADKDAARLAKALKDAGAIDSMNPNGINWQAAAPVYNTFGYKPLNANEVKQAKEQFQKLVRGGMAPSEAERQINLWLTSPQKKRGPIALATPTR